MAFGKKVVVKTDMSDYIIGVIAPSGFGKSTLMFQTCDKLYGDDGYLAIDFGLENGYGAIQGAMVEKCVTWDHFEEVVNDIVQNKEKEYPNLKVIICDTLDTAFECAEAYCIKKYNREHLGEQGFKKATTINQAYGGWGGGYDATIKIFKDSILKLRSVGVGMFYTAHCKEKEFADMFTGATYSQLTASMTNRYFNAIKDISYVIGFGYYSRDVEHKDVGKTNPVTNKKKGRDEITAECRKIKFRDDAYLVDAKSRFAQIVPEINLDVDEFIGAIQGAITSASAESVPLKASAKKKETIPEEYNDDSPEEDVAVNASNEEEYTEEEVKSLLKKIRTEFSHADIEIKKEVKKMLIENGDGTLNENLPISVLEKIYEVVTA